MFKKFLLILFLPFAAFAHATSEKPQITPPNGPLDHHNADIAFDVEFLWWYVTMTNLNYAFESQIIDQQDLNAVNPARTVVPKKIYEFDWGWDPGVRLGLGVVTNHDGWDVYADWTYTYNSTSDVKSVPPLASSTLNAATIPFGTNVLATSWGLFGVRTPLTRVSGRWSLLFHQIDLELGRKFWISRTLSLRPYGGLRGHWSRTYLRIKGNFEGTDAASPVGFLEETDRYHQRFWGVGLLGGIETAWHITKNWSVFIDGALSLIYGPFNQKTSFKQFATNPAGVQTTLVSTNMRHDDIYTLQSIYDLAIGLRWETTLYNEAYRLLFDAGWENHFWPHFNHLDANITGNSPIANAFMSSNGDLTLIGLVLRGRFEF